MLELIGIFAILFCLIVAIKAGALLLHVLLWPFQIAGALIVGVLAIPLFLVMVPVLVVGFGLFLIFAAGVAFSLVGGLLCAL